MTKRLNVKMVAWLLGGMIVVGAGTYLVRGYQIQRNAAALRHLAENAECNGEFQQAIKYYRLYLKYVPSDTYALAQCGTILVKLNTVHARVEALEKFETVLRRQPERHDIRRLLIEQAMHPEVGRFNDAKEHLDFLCRYFPSEGDLQFRLARCEEALRQMTAAAANYAAAIQITPTLIDAYRSLAELQHRELKTPAEAAKTLDLMVAANPQQAKAYLYRARYLRVQGRTEVKEDIRQARFAQASADLAQAGVLCELDADILFESVELAVESGQAEHARALVQRGLKTHAEDVRFHLAGARLEASGRRRHEAIAHLRRALEKAPHRHEILCVLAELVIEERDWKEAESIEAKLRQSGVAAPLLDYLKGCVLVEKGQWLEASQRLEKVRPQLVPWPEIAIRTDLLLGACHGQLGDGAQQELDLRRALGVDPLSEPACVGMGDAMLAKGQYSKAFDAFHTAAPWSSRARVRAGQALILHNLSMPAAQRRWEEVDSFLEPLARDPAHAVELALLRANVLAGKNQFALAGQVLAAAAARSPGTTSLWKAQAALLQRQEKWQEALAVIEEAEKKVGQHVEVSLARAQFWVERGGSEAPSALRALAQEANKLMPGCSSATIKKRRASTRCWPRRTARTFTFDSSFSIYV
jgi:cellulose synthase operon protein C